jgi:signal transduction histidine kinase
METSGPVPDLVRGDRLRIRQILINLLSNAVKYTDEGSVSLRVEAQPIDTEVRSPEPDITEDIPRDADLVLYFSVCDTGIGISKEEQAHLFDAFYQAGDDADRSHGGSGLGLNIVGKLVRALGGSLAIDSAPGAGSRFHVRLPVEAAAPDDS